MGEDERGEREKEREVIGAQCTVQRMERDIKKIKVGKHHTVLTVARFVVSILFPEIQSPVSLFWSSLFAATTLKKFRSAQRVSRLGVGRS